MPFRRPLNTKHNIIHLPAEDQLATPLIQPITMIRVRRVVVHLTSLTEATKIKTPIAIKAHRREAYTQSRRPVDLVVTTLHPQGTLQAHIFQEGGPRSL